MNQFENVETTSKSALNYLLERIKNQHHYTALKNAASFYNLTTTQYQIWLFQQLNPESSAFNNYDVWRIRGNFCKSAFLKAINHTAEKNRILRTIFVTQEGVPVQKIQKETEIEYNHYDLIRASEEDINDRITKEIKRPFELSVKPPVRITTFGITNDEFVVITVMHHIISDARTMSIYRKELFDLYTQISEAESSAIKKESVDFFDVIGSSNQVCNEVNEKNQSEPDFSRNTDELSSVQLPFTIKRSDGIEVLKRKGEKFFFDIAKETEDKFQLFCQNSEITPFAGYFSIFELLLSYHSNFEVVPIGIPVSNRNSRQLRNMLGPLTEVKCIRLRKTVEMSFIEFAKEAYKNINKELTSSCFAIKECDHNRYHNHQFRVAFVYQNEPIETISASFEDAQRMRVHNKSSKYDLTLIVYPQRKNKKFEIEIDTEIYEIETAKFIADKFERLINNICDNPSTQIGEMDYVSSVEKEMILKQFNATYSEYPNASTIPELFEKWVHRYPGKIAIYQGQNQITYQELCLRAKSVAAYLQNNINRNGENLIGIYMERSIDTIVAILGILYAGDGYVPLDANIPDERASIILNEAKVRAVIIQRSNSKTASFDKSGIPALFIDDLVKETTKLIQVSRNSQNVAYVMFTSGSTGKPKGVVIRHYSISKLVLNTNYIKTSSSDKFLQASTHSFDASTFEIWGALLNGAEMHMLSKHYDIMELAKTIDEKKITNIVLTTALFNALIDCDICNFEYVKYLFVGGEILSIKHANKARTKNPKMAFCNVYGPTENTTFTTWHEIEKSYNKDIPIGKPVSNTEVLIIKNNRLCGIGHIGEIYIGGDGLAREYLHDSELTQKRFVPHPFKHGKKLYRSGDMGRWLQDGSIEFIGRIDRQVKIRGYRVELDEIENAINRIEGIDEAVIEIVQSENGEKQLCAYYVSKYSLGQEFIIKNLRESLPEYMLPAYYQMIPQMPLSKNGKINRQALQLQAGIVSKKSGYEEPVDDIETKLLVIWKEILRKSKISVIDNFFEIGGQSLIAMVMIFRINKEFPFDISLRDIFDYPTIRKLAEKIKISLSLQKNHEIIVSDGCEEGQI